MSVKFKKSQGYYTFDELQNAPHVSISLPSATYMLLCYISTNMLDYITGNRLTNSKQLINRLVS